ncbi:MAG: DUF4097 family beta strand repeat-containing protein [Luteimonas sp.]
MKRALLAISLLACAAPSAWAATPINETRALDPRGSIDIDNLKGRIQVRVWDKPQVAITGSLGNGVEKLVIEGDRGNLVVRAQYPKHTDNGTEPTTLLLNVPTLASLDVHGVSADIDVSGTAGRSLSIATVSGDAVAVGAPGKADIESVSGDVRLTLNSGDVDVNSVSGDVMLYGRLGGEVNVETVSGKIDIDSRDQRMRKLSSNTVSGDASIRGNVADGGKLSAQSVSGDITITMPRTLSAHVTAQTFSGTLTAPGATVIKPKYGPGSTLDQRYGSGSADIQIETFSGDASFKLN